MLTNKFTVFALCLAALPSRDIATQERDILYSLSIVKEASEIVTRLMPHVTDAYNNDDKVVDKLAVKLHLCSLLTGIGNSGVADIEREYMLFLSAIYATLSNMFTIPKNKEKFLDEKATDYYMKLLSTGSTEEGLRTFKSSITSCKELISVDKAHLENALRKIMEESR